MRIRHLRASIGLVLGLAVLVTTGCGGSESSDKADGSTAAVDKPQVIRLAMTSEGPDDLAIWSAIEELESKGIKVEVKQFAEQEATIPAMVKGDEDVTINLALPTVVSAVEQGAAVKVIAGYTRNSMVLASTMKLTGPQDLAGKRIGVHSEASLTKALAQYYLEKNSIDDAKLLIVPGSDVRVQALSKDQLDAAVVSLTDYATLEEQYAGKFHTLVDFSKELPDLMAFTVTASDKWVDENPELAQTFVSALVNGFKKVSTLDEAMKYANEHYADFAATPELLETQVKLLVDGGYFPADGQLTPEVCKGSIQFLTDVGQIEGLTTVEPDKYCRYDVIDAARSGQ